MKIHNKFISILCAAAMIVSTLPAASAAEAEPLSKCAGETVFIQVIEETEGGWATRFVEVAIPEGATRAEELALTNSAALGQGAASPLSTTAEMSHFLSETTDLKINAREQKVGGGKKPAGVNRFDKYLVAVDIKEVDSTSVTLLFQVRDAANSGYASAWTSMSIATKPWRTYIIYSGFPESDQGVSLYAKTSSDWAVYLNYCYFYGIVS